MNLTVEAIYENGVLKLSQPLPLKEHARVQVTVHTEDSPLLRAYGILDWKGSVELAEWAATDPELDYPPPVEEP